MSSADFEQKTRSVINTLNSVLRTGALKEQDVGQQRLVLLVNQLLERGGPKGPLRLAPLYEHLRDRGLDEDDIFETLLVLKEREQALALPLVLPPVIEELSAEKKQQLLLRYQQRQLGTRSVKPASTPSEGSLPRVEPAKKSGAALPGRTKALLAGLFAVLVISGIAFFWLDSSDAPAIEPVTLDAPNGLPCKELKGNQGVLFCWMERAAYENIGPSERQTRALATKAAAAGLGYGTLQIWTLEDTKLRDVH